MSWSYSKSTTTNDRVWAGGGNAHLHWTRTWTVTELTPTQAGYIRLQVVLNTSEYVAYLDADGSIVEYNMSVSDIVSYGDTTVSIRVHTVGYHYGGSYTQEIQVPASWSGKQVQFRICGEYVTVTFGAAATYLLSITEGSNTAVTVLREGIELADASIVAAGDVLSIAVSAIDGYTATITVNGSEVASGSTYTVSGAVSIVTTASVITYSLSITQGHNTVVSVNRTNSPYGGGAQGYLNDGATLYYGDRITIQYSANAGYTVTTHTVNGTSFNSGTVYTVSESIAVVTAAIVNRYQLTRSIDAHLTLSITRLSSPLGGGPTGEIAASEPNLFHGDVLRIEAVPSSGYGVESLTVNGDSVTNPYTVVSAVNITAIAKALGFVHIDSGASIDRYKILIDSGSALEQYRAMIDTGSEIIPY